MQAPASEVRLRSGRGRPGFMAVTVVLAASCTAAVGWLGERFYDAGEVRAAELAEADQSARAEMLELGWQPLAPRVAGGAGPRLSASRGVELMAAHAPFSLPLGNGPVAGGAPNPAALELAAILVADELSRYPRELLERIRFRRVLLTSSLSEDAHPIPSLPNYQRTLLLDVDAPADFLRRLLHHELFHFADYADDDQVQRDPEWEKSNGELFVYGSGGRFVRDPRASLPSSARAGFVTGYATSALEEDKAETFAFVMVAPGAIEERAANDPILRFKIDAVKRQLARVSPSIDPAFWRRGGSVER